jgi:hypothetical protein
MQKYNGLPLDFLTIESAIQTQATDLKVSEVTSVAIPQFQDSATILWTSTFPWMEGPIDQVIW